MPRAARVVLADALRLGVKARAHVATELLASLDGPPDADAEQAWAVEIAQRIQQLDAGTAVIEPWDDVKRRIEQTLRRR